MKLYRYSLAYFRPALSQSWEKRRAEIDDIVVTIGSKDEESEHPDRRLVTACIELRSLPERDDQLRILIPNEVRAKCEDVSEHVINIISVLESCSREIASPIGCVALEPMDRDESDFLDSSQGILGVQKKESAAGWNIEWTPEIAAALSDRMDGVAMLSEAFSGGGDSGMYREFVRFLELAFSHFVNPRAAIRLPIQSEEEAMAKIELYRVAFLCNDREDAYLGEFQEIKDAMMFSFEDMMKRAGIRPKRREKIMDGITNDYIIPSEDSKTLKALKKKVRPTAKTS